MRNSLAKLIRLLGDKEKALEEMTVLLLEEQRCVIGFDPGALVELGSRTEEATARLSGLKRECGALIRQLGDELGVPGEGTLSPIVARLSTAEQAALRPVQKRVAKRAAALERQLDLNRGVLESSLATIGSSMAFFGRVLGGGMTYGAQGHLRSAMAEGNLLRLEI